MVSALQSLVYERKDESTASSQSSAYHLSPPLAMASIYVSTYSYVPLMIPSSLLLLFLAFCIATWFGLAAVLLSKIGHGLYIVVRDNGQGHH